MQSYIRASNLQVKDKLIIQSFLTPDLAFLIDMPPAYFWSFLYGSVLPEYPRLALPKT